MQPTFETADGAFRVILPNTHLSALRNIEEKYAPILKLLEKQRDFTRSEVEAVLGIGTTQAVNTLKEMLEKKLLKKAGSGSLTRYIPF